MAWIDNINDSSEPVFVFGCADGSLHLYRRKSDGVRMFFLTNKIPLILFTGKIRIRVYGDLPQRCNRVLGI